MHHWDLSYEAAVLRYIKTRFRLEVPAIDRQNHITSHVTTGTDIRCANHRRLVGTGWAIDQGNQGILELGFLTKSSFRIRLGVCTTLSPALTVASVE